VWSEVIGEEFFFLCVLVESSSATRAGGLPRAPAGSAA
jgi:hypothetical protein